MSGASARKRIESICAALPEVVSEAQGEGVRHVGFTIRGRRFAWFLDDHHGDGRLAVVVKAPPGENTRLVREEPERLFLPDYLGPRGWVAARLDLPGVDWDRVEELVADSYRMSAPKKLASRV